jgi:hypothetical protein
MKTLLAVSLIILASPAVCQIDSCITPTQRAAIVVTNLTSSDTLWFGFHPLGTCGIDSMLCGEATPWPPSSDTLEARWASMYSPCLPPARFDYRGYVSPTAADTHSILISSNPASQWPVYVRWNPNSIAQMCDSAKLQYTDGPYFRTKWMQRDSNVTLDSWFLFSYLHIICYGQRTTSVSMTGAKLPGSFVLYQNFPNPFNPTTVIRFQIAISSLVTLTVVDLLGRKVETLQDGQMSPGFYERTFNASKIPSGVYISRLTAGPYTQTTKMLVLK